MLPSALSVCNASLTASLTNSPLFCICCTEDRAADRNALTRRSISSVDCWVRLARARTSSATTANPLPSSPALAASIAALSASRLVCSATLLMTPSTVPMFWISALKLSMLELAEDAEFASCSIRAML